MVGRTVLITGGAGDIGLAVAHAFAREGAAIALLDLRAVPDDAVRSLSNSGAAAVRCFALDVADADAVSDVVDTTYAQSGRLDVIVNVAGMMIYKAVSDLTAQDWRKILDVNLIGAALLVGHGLRLMKPGGAIVNVASVHARRTSPLVAPYAAAKAALVSLTRSAAIEGKPLGVRVNAILPGAVDTAMLRMSPNIRSGAEILDPADVGQPEDIAELALFLASDAARFITGEDIVADGGRMGRL